MSEDCVLVYSASFALWFIWKTEPEINGPPDRRRFGPPCQNSMSCNRLTPCRMLCGWNLVHLGSKCHECGSDRGTWHWSVFLAETEAGSVEHPKAVSLNSRVPHAVIRFSVYKKKEVWNCEHMIRRRGSSKWARSGMISTKLLKFIISFHDLPSHSAVMRGTIRVEEARPESFDPNNV